MLGEAAGATAEQQEAAEEAAGVNQPLGIGRSKIITNINNKKQYY